MEQNFKPGLALISLPVTGAMIGVKYILGPGREFNTRVFVRQTFMRAQQR